MDQWKDQIEKYKKGELSPQEMHALEKQALDDSFLKDALEGLETLSPDEFNNDLRELHQKIVGRKPSKKYFILRIAAGFAVIALTAGLIFLINNNTEKSPLASNEKLGTRKDSLKNQSTIGGAKVPEKTEVEKSSGFIAQNNQEKKPAHSPSKDNPTTTLTIPSKSGSTPVAKIEDAIPGSESKRNPDQITSAGESNKADTKKNLGEIAQNNEDEQHATSQDKKDKVTPPTTPLLSTTPTEEKTVTEVTTDEQASSDSRRISKRQKNKNSGPEETITKNLANLTKKELVAASPTESKAGTGAINDSGVPQQGEDESPVQIVSGTVSDQNGQPLPGVNITIKGTTTGVVSDASGYYSLRLAKPGQTLVYSFIGFQTAEQKPEQQKKSNVDVQLQEDAAQLSEVVVTGFSLTPTDNHEEVVRLAEPVGGRRAFDKYIESAKKYPQQAIENKIEGKVIVEFTVEISGTLSDFTVTKSLGFGCDEELLRLIKEGPRWTPSYIDNEAVESLVRIKTRFSLPNKK